MKIIRQLDRAAPDLQGGALAIGNFDGVHRGHARLVERLVFHARRLGGQAIVFTFDPHPVRLLRPDTAPPPLTWTDRKAQLLEHLGVDAMVAYPTDESLLALGPREFFELIVRKQIGARAMVEGPNFFFGHHRAGTIDVLRSLTDE
ncbi:MAG TPA: bifunctional riboflavin kinase/FAD synthetase, partial [Pirellulales bacterium]|nr:bifunctional riboflavin kinase/FAD synthetase [Pirellulales bacterium]